MGPLGLLVLALPIAGVISGCVQTAGQGDAGARAPAITDHFNGERYFNPGELATPPSPATQPSPGRHRGWIWRWLLGNEWPAWPEVVATPVGPRPVERVERGQGPDAGEGVVEGGQLAAVQELLGPRVIHALGAGPPPAAAVPTKGAACSGARAGSTSPALRPC